MLALQLWTARDLGKYPIHNYFVLCKSSLAQGFLRLNQGEVDYKTLYDLIYFIQRRYRYFLIHINILIFHILRSLVILLLRSVIHKEEMIRIFGIIDIFKSHPPQTPP